MSKIEIDLKNDFDIVEEGTMYKVPMYEVIEGEGLVYADLDLRISFVRGSKLGSDNIQPRTGTLHEHLLSMMIHDLEYKYNLVPSPETEEALRHLKSASNWLLQRQIKRTLEGKLSTYKK